MQWDEVSGEARETMRFLGYFQPTVTPAHKMLKGCLADDDKVYITGADLREMAVHFIEVADWLDKRHNESANARVKPRREAASA